MYKLIKNLAWSSAMKGAVAVVAAMAALNSLLAAETEKTFRGQKIYYEGAELKWIGDEKAGDAELLLIYKNGGTFRPSRAAKARVLAVGGGGAGGTVRSSSQTGHPGGGGGGAGELVDRTGVPFAAEERLTITVGAGGAATGVSGTASVGADGEPSSIKTATRTLLLVNGGGGGGGESIGRDGGSGGGGSNTDAAGGSAKKNEEDGCANAGGSSSKRAAGGGGGAGSAGVNGVNSTTSSTGGKGGDGVESDINPFDVRYYAGGGGGGVTLKGDVGAGGQGGGGNGGYLDNLSTPTAAPTAGEANTGSGGGGGGRYWPGAAGGSGIVIIRLTDIEQPKEWRAVAVSRGGNDSYIFIDSNAEDPKTLGTDLILTYTDPYNGGGLSFSLRDDMILIPSQQAEREKYAANVPIWANARILAIGGGGGGGMVDTLRYGGGAGGGAGGFVETSGHVFDNTVVYSITVGKGGSGGDRNEGSGEKGGDSSVTAGSTVFGEVARGGGGGGAVSPGNDGASGGGGSYGKSNVPELGGWTRQGGQGIEGQGFAGGLGGVVYRGAGGGGAGGPGGDALNSSNRGDGGCGKSSDITGELKWYAGGGGGAYIYAQTADTRAGVGGGNEDGTIIVGGAGAYVDNSAGAGKLKPVPATQGIDGTGSGGGGGISRDGEVGESAARGGHGVVIIRLSGIIVKNVPLPKPNGPFTYDGQTKVGVDPFFAYTRSGDYEAVNADVYTVTCTIAPDAPYGWDDVLPTDPRYRGDRKVTWKITPMPVRIPSALTGFVFDNTPKVAMFAVDAGRLNGGVDANGCCWTNGLIYCRLTDFRLTDACKTNFVASLNFDDGLTNYIWQSGAYITINDQKIGWSIAQAKNEITGLTLANWQEGTTPAQPSCHWTWENVTKTYPNPDRVTYQWRRRKDGAQDPWSEASADFEPPEEAGVYDLRAAIVKDSNHEPGNWASARAETTFCVWRHPSKSLTDYVDITIAGNGSGGTALKNFPVLVRLKEPVNGGKGGGLPGFTYSRAGADGSQLRFISMATADYAKPDAEREDKSKDVLLPYEVDTWDVTGESLVWVRIPSVANTTTKFRMYWHRIPSATIEPDLPASDTWSADYIGVWHMNALTPEGELANSAPLGAALNATGEVSLVKAKIGNAAQATDGAIVIPNFGPYLTSTSKYALSTWMRADKWKSGGKVFMGTRAGTANAPGWCWYHDTATRALFYTSDSNMGWFSSMLSMPTQWNHLGLVVQGATSLATYYNYIGSDSGSSKKLSATTKPMTFSDEPLTVTAGYSVDEMRLSRVDRTDAWMRAEHESMNNANYCKFGLVNQQQADGTHAWINWWTTEPSIKRYWDVNELTKAKVNAVKGALFAGIVTNRFVAMPSAQEVVFPDAGKIGAYTVEFMMHNDRGGVSPYLGPHVLFDGSRMFDIEIVDHIPQPIDPGGALGSTVSGRVLLANDDTNPAGAVEGQGYWRTNTTDNSNNPFWKHLGTPPPSIGVNLLDGSSHELCYVENAKTTNVLWKLTEVYMGNLMRTNGYTDASTFVLSNRFNTLPWAKTTTREVGQLLMRNTLDACIESSLLTNGVGTVYFDAVNAYGLSDVKGTNFQLRVEVSGTNGVWRQVRLQPLSVSGTTVTKAAACDDLNCLAAVNGGKTSSFKFYRVYAEVNDQEATRVRIRRVTTRPRPLGAALADDVDGFILLDNLIVSWPPPVPSISPMGVYDPSRRGKSVLGVEGAFSTPYPAAGDQFYANVSMNRGTQENLASARIHYRWRYLDSLFDPVKQSGRDTWRTQYFSVTNRAFSTIGPLEYNGRAGDIEYYFDITALVPFYKYIDYCGLTLAKPTSDYTEEPDKYQEIRSDYGRYPSHGTDWFVRLREGASDYGRVRALVRRHGATELVPVEVDLELVSDHIWRGFMRMAEDVSVGYDYRFEMVRPASGGVMKGQVTNHWRAAESPSLMPVSSLLEPVGADEWAKLPGKRATGHYMFQVDDKAMAVSVVHADYQDFNKWNDAYNAGNQFTGTSIDGTSGVSAQMRDYDERFLGWTDSAATNTLWTERFVDGAATKDGDYFKNGYAGFPICKKFTSASTLNNWSVGAGQFIPGLYQTVNVSAGLALQMEGLGNGFMQFIDGAQSPRGLESVSFRARIAQGIGFDDFCYYDAGGAAMKRMTDYAFVTFAAFDRNENKNFSGNATLSLVAFYRPGVGCYEARWEQIEAEFDTKTKLPKGPNPQGQRLSLFRWAKNGANVVTCTPLGSITNNAFAVPATTADAGSKFLPFFISAKANPDGSVSVMAGVRREPMSTANELNTLGMQKFFAACYLDKSGSQLSKGGTYGVLSANCEGLFAQPAAVKSSVPFPSGVTVVENKLTKADNHLIGFSTDSADYTYVKDQLDVDPAWSEWVFDNARMKAFGLGSGEALWGIDAKPQSQKLAVYVAPAGTANWTRLTNDVTVVGFGSSTSSGKAYTNYLWTTESCSVKIATGGTEDEAVSDIVIDDVEMRQWGGEDYGGYGTFHAPDDGYGWRTNFIYTSGWVVDQAVRLSAKRTKVGANSALRSPLMDGKDGRGLGLGMISFEYRNAQPNVKLLVDIATNLTSGTAKIGEDKWCNFTNIDFTVMSDLERSRGSMAFYIGLREVPGMMRIRLDPEVVASVSNTTDLARFGEIDITRVLGRDEPKLGDGDWWGWNLRSTDAQDEAYLPDQTFDAALNGLSYVLNNSVTDGVVPDDLESVKQHMPFLQTPTFASDIVGEVMFRARKLDLDASSQRAEVRIYGAQSGQLSEDDKWQEIGHVVVSNTWWTSYKVPVNGSYHAFRLGVTGVPDVKDGSRGPQPSEGTLPVRVMIEEVAVSQAITPVLGFKYIYPFRDGLGDNAPVAGILSCDQQPMLGESWSVQAQIEPKQLPEQIDLTTPGREPRVIFHWYAGTNPWGYDNWAERGQSTELVRADGESMVFRGGFTAAPEAVVDPSIASTFDVVQYSAEVIYWSINGKCKTNTLSETEWKRPAWYYPLDYNNIEYARWHSFSAYNIMETIAPNRVWFNEVNVYDGQAADYTYPAATNQYIEVAAPMQQSLDGWRIDYISSQNETNTLCTFGWDKVSSVKTMNATNEYVFFTVQSPRTRDAKSLDASKGEVDGTWLNFSGTGGELDESNPIGLRLVRPSQIVEQEIVLEGTNSWAGSRYAERFSAEKKVADLNAAAEAVYGTGTWYLVGNEYKGGLRESLGVTNFIGDVIEDWTSPMQKTAGRVNVGQNVPMGYVIYPNGALMVVYSSVDANGHVRQTFGMVTNSVDAAIGVATKGADGTNITYEVDAWWEVKELTTNGVPVADWEGRTGRLEYTAGKGESNSVYVVLTVQPREDVRKLIGANNPYERAILSWLDGGVTKKGAFENPGEIQLGEYWPYVSNPKYRGRRKLDLTEEYWLDIDPTSSNWVLHAGFSKAPYEVPMDDPSRSNAVRMAIYMAITNVNEESEKFGQNWSPYMLRGLAPGETSEGYQPESSLNWTSVTFKITGDLQNGMPLRERWVPQRWFTFKEGSFDDKHVSTIDILNPFDPASAGSAIGWRKYIGKPVWFSWNIDTRLAPVSVEVLDKECKLTTH